MYTVSGLFAFDPNCLWQKQQCKKLCYADGDFIFTWIYATKPQRGRFLENKKCSRTNDFNFIWRNNSIMYKMQFSFKYRQTRNRGQASFVMYDARKMNWVTHISGERSQIREHFVNDPNEREMHKVDDHIAPILHYNSCSSNEFRFHNR